MKQVISRLVKGIVQNKIIERDPIIRPKASETAMYSLTCIGCQRDLTVNSANNQSHGWLCKSCYQDQENEIIQRRHRKCKHPQVCKVAVLGYLEGVQVNG